MNDPIQSLNLIDKFIVERGSSQAMIPHIAFLRDIITEIKEKNEALKKENSDLKERNAYLESQLSSKIETEQFIEWKDVLIKRMPSGGYSDTPFCPKCKLPMSAPMDGFGFICTMGCKGISSIKPFGFNNHIESLES